VSKSSIVGFFTETGTNGGIQKYNQLEMFINKIKNGLTQLWRQRGPKIWNLQDGNPGEPMVCRFQSESILKV
jgi:hypothetical protein